jgi:choline dehydrogenase
MVADAYATRILLDGKRARGVAYRRSGQEHRALALREVILCVGAIQSPQLLQLSGIGDAERLHKFGIETVHNLPGVGRNLQDHLQIRLIHRCNKAITTNPHIAPVGHRP